MKLDVYHRFPEHREDPVLKLLDSIFNLIKTVVINQENQMSAIDDFIVEQTAFNASNSAVVESISTAVAGLTGDVQNLDAQIAALQAATGGLTAEQEAALATISETSGVVSAKLATLSDALTALDALTPPVAPPVV